MADQRDGGIAWTDASWNPVPIYSGFFACDDGRLRGPSGRELRPMTNAGGYLYVLTKRARPRKLFVHRAVLMAFVGLPPERDSEARHLNGDKLDNRASNLAWGTAIENAADKARHGTQSRGETSASAKLTEQQVRELRALKGTSTLRELGRRFGVSHTAVRRAINGTKWKHLEG